MLFTICRHLKSKQILLSLSQCRCISLPLEPFAVNFSCTSNSNEDGGSGSDNSSNFKRKILKKYLQPNEFSVNALKQTYPAPKSLIDELFEPFRKADRKTLPTLRYKPLLGGEIWKANLQFQWPAVITVSGKHPKKEQAEENAYLSACRLFTDMGFIQVHNQNDHCRTAAMTPDDLMTLVENLSKPECNVGIHYGMRKEITIHVVSSVIDTGSGADWQASVYISSPFSFVKSSTAPTFLLAYHKACLLTLMRFKRLHILDNKNKTKPHPFLHSGYPESPLENFVADHEIYTDASGQGIGAYLLTRDDDTVRWLADTWTDQIHFDPTADSNMSELYALVTACFTWKHKLCNKKVVCYTDNWTVVNIVNRGMYGVKYVKVGYERLFCVLSNTCKGRNITLVAAYVHRGKNVAADYLSRSNVMQFKHTVPNAHPNPKKSKKLYFLKWKSFLDVDYKQQKRP